MKFFSFFAEHGINGNFCVALALARGASLLFSRQLSARFLRGFRLDDAHLRPRHEETKRQVTRRLTSVEQLAANDNGAPETITSSNCLARATNRDH